MMDHREGERERERQDKGRKRINIGNRDRVLVRWNKTLLLGTRRAYIYNKKVAHFNNLYTFSFEKEQGIKLTYTINITHQREVKKKRENV